MYRQDLKNPQVIGKEFPNSLFFCVCQTPEKLKIYNVLIVNQQQFLTEFFLEDAF